MPTRLMESYGQLYYITQDGSYAKLSDIKDFDIGSSEPPETFAAGGEIKYEDAPMYEYPPDQPDDILPVASEMNFSAHIFPKLSMKRLYMTLIGLTKREQRLAIRQMERLRRKELKTGVKLKNRLVAACMTVQLRSKKNRPEFTIRIEGQVMDHHG